MRLKSSIECICEAAKQAIKEGRREFGVYKIYTAKIDLDVNIADINIDMWERSRKAVLESLPYSADIVVIDIKTYKTERGLHTIINYLYPHIIPEDTLNLIQLMLGDDIIRYKINKKRIERGISWDRANILFSRVLDRYGKEEDSRLKVALERIVGRIK